MILDTPFVDEIFGVDLTKNLELEELRNAKFGYDLRFIFKNVKDKKKFIKELADVFLMAEETFKPEFTVMSYDHREGNKFVVEAYKIFMRECSSEPIFVEGILSTTIPPFFSAALSAREGARILALHATASHNPPEYSGVKLWQGVEREFVVENVEYSKKLRASYAIQLYKNFLRSFFPKKFPKITLDLSWGAGSILSDFFEKAGFNVINNVARKDFGGLIPEPERRATFCTGFKADGDFDRAVLYHNYEAINFSEFLLSAALNGYWPFSRVVADLRTPPIMVERLKEAGVQVIQGTTGRNYQELIASKVEAFWYEENWHTGGFTLDGKYLAWAEAPLAVLLFSGVLNYIKPKRMYFSKEFRLKGVKLPKRLSGWKELRYHRGFWKKVDSGYHIVIRESKTEKDTVKIYATGENEEMVDKNIKSAIEELKTI